MSRYVFIAAATLFAGLLLVLALAVAQHDARIGHSLTVDSQPEYADQLVSPISIEADAATEVARVTETVADRQAFDSSPILASYNEPVFQDVGQESPSTAPRKLAEPPRFDASRIISKRPNERESSARLLPPIEPSSSPFSSSPFSSPPDLPSSSPIATPRQLDVNVPPVHQADRPSATLGAPMPIPVSEPPVLTELPGAPQTELSTPALPRAALPTAMMPPTTIPGSSLPVAGTFGAPPALPASPPRSDAVPRGAWARSSGAPGARQFDGSQNPSLEIHKRAPSEVQVGIPATFTAVVRNVGNATAFDVQVLDTIPEGAKLIRTVPEADAVDQRGLVWNLGELAAGQETTISMELVPETEGELGSIASVKFAAQASVRTVSTLPKLTVKQVAPTEILGGDSLNLVIEVSNTGTGTARDVQLEEDVPSVFRHSSGARSLGLLVGDLAPGESQRYDIELVAVDPGKTTNIVRATAQNAATNASSFSVEIKAPKLHLQVVGPRIRHLERPAPFEAVIENTGTAAARDLYIVAYLPRGLHYTSATNEGTYLPNQHAIAWNLAELAAGTKATTEFTLLPVEEGRFTLRMTSDAQGLSAESVERDVQVEGQSELTFDIDDDHDPIEVAGVTTYSVHLTNIGTRSDRDVQLTLEMPDGSSLEDVNGPTKYQVQGQTIQFAPLPSMDSKQQMTFKVSIRHAREGTQIIRASLRSALRSVPVIKEESTQVYVDR